MNPTPLAATLFLALAATHAQASDVVFYEDGIVIPPGLDGHDRTGWAVDVDGDTMAVAARAFGPGNSPDGAVFVYLRAGNGWDLQQMLVGSHVTEGDGFGTALDLQGDRLVIGSAYDENGGGTGDSGSAYVFERAGGVWYQRARLAPPTPEPGGHFGVDVALEGERIAVGASGADLETGDVTIFERVAGTWTVVQVLGPTAPGSMQWFGDAVDMEGDRLVVGAPRADLQNETTTARTGAVYVFEHDGLGFVPEASLAGAFPGLEDYGTLELGQAVAIDGDTIVAGAPWTDEWRGFGFVFERSAGTWSQSAVLASAVRGTGLAGQAVAVDGDRIALGCPFYPFPNAGPDHGAVTLWERQSGGWVERALLTTANVDAGSTLGWSVAFDGERVLAGDPFNNLMHVNDGALFLFTVPATTGESFCFGDGLGTACPCGANNGTPQAAGCMNSSSHGAVLMGIGTPSVAADDLALVTCNLLSNQPALLFHGTTELGAGDGLVFGNGLRCVGGTSTRVSVVVPDDAGGATWTGLVASEGFTPGQLARFQVWYRDPGAACGQGFNLSNGYRVDFQP